MKLKIYHPSSGNRPDEWWNYGLFIGGEAPTLNRLQPPRRSNPRLSLRAFVVPLNRPTYL